MTRLGIDGDGFPVLLSDSAIFAPPPDTQATPADTPSGVPNTRTDNQPPSDNQPSPDATRPQQGAATPPNVDPVEWGRFMDAVRTASREIPNPKPGDIQDFIRSYAKDHTKVDPKEFERSIREQRLTDLVDILDQKLRRSGSQPRARRMVRVVAPQSFVNQVVGSLDHAGIAEVQHRLESLGHQQGDVEKFFADNHPKHVNDQTQPQIAEAKQALSNG